MSTTIDPVVLQQLVAQAVRQLQKEGPQAAAPAVPAVHDEYGVFTTMADAIEASAAAQHTLLFQSPSQRQQWIDVIRQTCLDKNNMQMMSRMAVEETEIGRYEDKVIKNTAAARYTPGIEDLKTDARTGEHGLVLFEYCPFGVIGAITPTTNPTETIINNSICMIAGGNTVVFSPQPRAKKTSIFLVQLLNKALYEAGAPLNLITMVREPSIEATDEMISNPKVRRLSQRAARASSRKSFLLARKPSVPALAIRLSSSTKRRTSKRPPRILSMAALSTITCRALRKKKSLPSILSSITCAST